MRKTQRLFALVLVLALALSALSGVSASDTDTLAADTLYTLGIVRGDGRGYALDRPLTRAEAMTLIVRLSGGEGKSGAHPFLDVPDWADGYIGWAYVHGLTRGVSETAFDCGSSVSVQDFVTMVLRAMGYGDVENAQALSVGAALGLCRSSYAAFTRGDAFRILLRALSCETADGLRLADALRQQGILDRAVLNAVGLSETPVMDARRIFETCADAVFCLYTYTSDQEYKQGVYAATSSGFFLRGDGIAVTNYHAIDGMYRADAMLLSGERYEVERVVYYSTVDDIAVLKISQTSKSGGTETTFSALPLGRFESVVNGQKVFAISCPLGLEGSITEGIVSTREREVDGFEIPLIQNSASISKGSSGGALLNEYGEVIGIICAYYAYGFDLYLAVPVYALEQADYDAQGKTLAQVAQAEAKESILIA